MSKDWCNLLGAFKNCGIPHEERNDILCVGKMGSKKQPQDVFTQNRKAVILLTLMQEPTTWNTAEHALSKGCLWAQS